MKSTGIVRRVDDLGRVVIPKELRRTFGIKVRDPLEIFVEGDKIILSRYDPGCVFCGSSKNAVDYKGKHVCSSCRKRLSDEAA